MKLSPEPLPKHDSPDNRRNLTRADYTLHVSLARMTTLSSASLLVPLQAACSVAIRHSCCEGLRRGVALEQTGRITYRNARLRRNCNRTSCLLIRIQELTRSVTMSSWMTSAAEFHLERQLSILNEHCCLQRGITDLYREWRMVCPERSLRIHGSPTRLST